MNEKTPHGHRLESSILLRQLYSPNDLQIQCSPYQNYSGLFSFCRNDLSNSQIHMQLQGTLISQNNIEKEKVGGFILPDFKTYESYSN